MDQGRFEKHFNEPLLWAKQFKTHAGALRRAERENACNKTYRFEPVRCLDGEPDNEPIDRSKFERYTWRLRKMLRF